MLFRSLRYWAARRLRRLGRSLGLKGYKHRIELIPGYSRRVIGESLPRMDSDSALKVCSFGTMLLWRVEVSS